MRIHAAALILALFTSCTAPVQPGVDGGPDLCREDRECDDGLFCNGRERCLPGAREADDYGCAPGAAPCAAPRSCEEEDARCVTPCDVMHDADGDGHDAIECGGTDCDDGDAEVFLGQVELCDPEGVDEDCDPSTFGFVDEDGDGAASIECCNGERCGGDCDDADGSVSPVAPEACNGVDDDCDGAVDEGAARPFYPDGDGDGFGALGGTPTSACAQPPGTSTLDTDCDDTTRSANPGAPEICDEIDNDCDGAVDEDVLRLFYPDADGDGFGDPRAPPTRGCTPPPGFVADASDCDDTERTRRPGGVERCNAVPDEDCDPSTSPFDADRDGYDDAPCGPDCDPGDARVHPGALERCNGADDDCSSGGGLAADEDADGDGFVSAAAACTGGSLAPGDCDDASAARFPGAGEQCNGIDDDCDGAIDDAPDVALACAAPFATTSCVAGACAISACAGMHRDCDGAASTGCETDVASSPQHCGACGVVCGVAARCVSGSCARDVVRVDQGIRHACAVRAAGGVACWGDGALGQRGDGRRDSPSEPTAAFGIADAVDAAAGLSHTCVLRASGRVACAGLAADGRLGNGELGSPSTVSPLFVDVLDVDDAVAIAAGEAHTCVVRASGTVACWGVNSLGQLGDGTTTARAIPVPVAGVGGAVAIFAGSSHTCAIGTGGTLACWGADGSGQLGDARPGPGRFETRPVTVAGLSDVIAGDGGLAHTCVVLASGGVRCFGANGEGQLGDGTTTDSLEPATVRGVAGFGTLSDAVEVDAGRTHTCARRSSGALACWGANGFGQLGIGVATTRATFPVAVSGIPDGISVTAGMHSSCAVRSDARVFCWGDGTPAPVAVPRLP